MRTTGINLIQNFTEFYLILTNFTNFMDLQTVCYERQSNLHVA
jgi:hypothetical protein